MRKTLVLLAATLLLVGCAKKETPKKEAAEKQQLKQETTMPVTEMPDVKSLDMLDGPEGLKYHVFESGNGPKVQNGQTAVVQYTGWLMDGKMFDSSYKHGKPFEFKVGAGQVIKGWDIAVGKMKVGDKWLIVLPPELAYGNRAVGHGLIPANSTLAFMVEVQGVK